MARIRRSSSLLWVWREGKCEEKMSQADGSAGAGKHVPWAGQTVDPVAIVSWKDLISGYVNG